MMTYANYYQIMHEAAAYTDKELFVAEWSTSSVFDADSDGDAPDYDGVLTDLDNIWTVSHMSVKEMAEAAGLTQSDLARRFNIPLRTLRGWSNGTREAPPYIKLMMADLLGLVTVRRK